MRKYVTLSLIACAVAPVAFLLAARKPEAKIAESAARATALAQVPGGTVREAELETENGILVFSYDISVAGQDGIEEVQVDANTGQVVSRVHETDEDEAAEAAEDDDDGGVEDRD